MSDNYNANNIKIQDITTDIWSMSISLSEEFNYNESLIVRALEACDLANVPYSYFIDRYLKKIDIPLNKDVDIIYRELSRVHSSG